LFENGIYNSIEKTTLGLVSYFFQRNVLSSVHVRKGKTFEEKKPKRLFETKKN
jgi:hypothetical protein